MFRKTLAAVAAVVLISASLMPDDAFARRGGGGGCRGGYHGGARVGGFMAVATALPVEDTAGRGSAGSTRRGPQGVYRGVAVGAGAAAVGTYGYYNNGCHRDATATRCARSNIDRNCSMRAALGKACRRPAIQRRLQAKHC